MAPAATARSLDRDSVTRLHLDVEETGQWSAVSIGAPEPLTTRFSWGATIDPLGPRGAPLRGERDQRRGEELELADETAAAATSAVMK